MTVDDGDSVTLTLAAHWSVRDGATTWRPVAHHDSMAAPGSRVILDLTDIPAATDEVIELVRRLTGSASSVHVVGGVRPATRALLVAALLGDEDGRGTTGRQWSGADAGPAQTMRGPEPSPYRPDLTWTAGMVLRDRDSEEVDLLDEAPASAGTDGP